jgi:hypothetical protein
MCIASERVDETLPSAILYIFSLNHFNPCRYLSSNQLTGPIPDTIGNLSQLQALYDEWQFFRCFASESVDEALRVRSSVFSHSNIFKSL